MFAKKRKSIVFMYTFVAQARVAITNNRIMITIMIIAQLVFEAKTNHPEAFVAIDDVQLFDCEGKSPAFNNFFLIQ